MSKPDLSHIGAHDEQPNEFLRPPAPLPALGQINAAKPPDVPDRYAITAAALEPVVSVLDASDAMDSLTHKALKRQDELLDIELPKKDGKHDTSHADFLSIAKVVQSGVNTVLNTQVRVDEARLRRRSIDKLPELLKLIAEEERRLPGALTILDAVAAE